MATAPVTGLAQPGSVVDGGTLRLPFGCPDSAEVESLTRDGRERKNGGQRRELEGLGGGVREVRTAAQHSGGGQFEFDG